MANARVFMRSVEDIQRSGAEMTLFIDSFVFITGESQVQRHLIDVTITNFQQNTFKTQMRNGITQWVTDHLGDTVINIILPDFVPL